MEQKNKRRKIFYISLTSIFLILFISSTILTIYITSDKVLKSVDYNEKGKVIASVCLNDNSYIKKKCLDGNQNYVTDLIDYINVTFDYDMNVSENAKYEYNYQIIANTSAVEKNNKDVVVYENSETLATNNSVSTKHKNFNVSKSFKLDYKKYNNLINEFKKDYTLDIDSNLKIEFNLNIVTTVNDMPQKIQKNYVSSITIPLSKKTIEFSYDNNDYKYNDKIVKLRPNEHKYGKVDLLCDIIYKLDILYIAFSIIFFTKIRPKKRKFDKVVDKIVRMYDKDIIETDAVPKFKSMKIFEVKEIKELIDAKNALNRPIMHYATHSFSLFYITTQDEVYYYQISSKDF